MTTPVLATDLFIMNWWDFRRFLVRSKMADFSLTFSLISWWKKGWGKYHATKGHLSMDFSCSTHTAFHTVFSVCRKKGTKEDSAMFCNRLCKRLAINLTMATAINHKEHARSAMFCAMLYYAWPLCVLFLRIYTMILVWGYGVIFPQRMM